MHRQCFRRSPFPIPGTSTGPKSDEVNPSRAQRPPGVPASICDEWREAGAHPPCRLGVARPDPGFRRWERSAVLGSSPELWEWASTEVLRWSVKTRSRFGERVRRIEKRNKNPLAHIAPAQRRSQEDPPQPTLRGRRTEHGRVQEPCHEHGARSAPMPEWFGTRREL